MSLTDGKIVHLICQGDGSYKYLDGDPNNGEMHGGVYLQQSPTGHPGTRWKVKSTQDRLIALQCLGEGPSIWLSITRNAAWDPTLTDFVALTQFETTWWVEDAGTGTGEPAVIGYYAFLIANGPPKYLDGNPGDHTPWGRQVGLQATRGGYKGAVWKVVEAV